MKKNKLLDAYTDLMEHIYEVMDDTLHSFAEALEMSKPKVARKHDLTDEEMDEVSRYVRRDVEHAAHHDLKARRDNESLSEWFRFDVELLENFALDAFLSVADKTRVELAKIEELAKVHRYKSGEITIPGTFICDACGKEIAFRETGEIPACPACGGQVFIRI